MKLFLFYLLYVAQHSKVPNGSRRRRSHLGHELVPMEMVHETSVQILWGLQWEWPAPMCTKSDQIYKSVDQIIIHPAQRG